MNAVFSSCYAGNIDYYSCLYKTKELLIDIHENYIKQSFRNRCEIYGANGKLPLVIPIVRRNGKTPLKDVKIEYCQGWQKIHWKSLESSYRSSPFFEYYEDKFIGLYEQKNITFLIDFNIELQNIFIQLLGLEIEIKHTDSYKKEHKDMIDVRGQFHPKKMLSDYYTEIKYNQVFEEKFGFISNLSIYDLIFNEGPAAVHVLS